MPFLDVSKAQEDYVASTMYSLAEAKVYTENIPLSVYNDDVMVGFLMYQLDPNDKEYWITRLLIDKKYQNLGYGTKAMHLLLEKLKKDHNIEQVLISFDPENQVAEKMYVNMGFRDTGRIEDEEKVFVYTYEEVND